jgi:hypothetical protein
MFGVDVEKLTEDAVAPFLEKLDGLQATLDALLALEERRDAERKRREQRGEQQ